MLYCFMGEKIIDIVMRRDAVRGRKSKAGGRLGKKFSVPILIWQMQFEKALWQFWFVKNIMTNIVGSGKSIMLRSLLCYSLHQKILNVKLRYSINVIICPASLRRRNKRSIDLACTGTDQWNLVWTWWWDGRSSKDLL